MLERSPRILAVAYSDLVSVVIRMDVDGEHARLAPTGSFELAHAADIARAVARAEHDLDGRRDVVLDLSSLERIDGAGAVLLAGLIDRLEARGLPHPLHRGAQPARRQADHTL